MISTEALPALETLRRVFTDTVCTHEADLSARQMAVLLTVTLSHVPHTVRGLALHLGISKPAVSRALDRLGELGYLARRRDADDRRNVFVESTSAGETFLEQFAAVMLRAQQSSATTSARLSLPIQRPSRMNDAAPALPQSLSHAIAEAS